MSLLRTRDRDNREIFELELEPFAAILAAIRTNVFSTQRFTIDLHRFTLPYQTESRPISK